MNLKLIYITAPDKLTARSIAKAIIEEKLAACANILGPIESFYIWENKLNQDKEVLLLAKTAKESELISRVKQLHPYECPCILSFDISNGEPEFLKWISNTSSTN